MRGAPQVGFSATIRKIKARTSLLTRFRPPTWLILETHVQYKRNPARCQFTTVLGVTKMSGLVHPDQNVRNATQNSLCRAVNPGRGCCPSRASNCRRRARFSRKRSSRERKALTNQPRKCRSDTIMARIVAEKSESSLSPSHSFCGCTMFWRGTGRGPQELPNRLKRPPNRCAPLATRFSTMWDLHHFRLCKACLTACTFPACNRIGGEPTFRDLVGRPIQYKF